VTKAAESAAPLARFEGENGAVVEIFDQTRPYGYQNLFVVRLAVRGSFPGGEERFERLLERMGVYEEELDAARKALVEEFQTTALPYLFRADFSERLAAVRQKAAPRRPTGYEGSR